MTILERFLSKVNKQENGCWLWTGARDKNGYGWFNGVGKPGGHTRANRQAWMFFRGDIPKGLFVCHTCDTPSCVNPDHLFLGTNNDNRQDSKQKGRTCRGTRVNTNRLSESQVHEIRKRYIPRVVTQKYLAEQYGVSESAVGLIITNRNWKWLKT